tara:strand:- start:395 stop:586 length:192 start_codon:yes stop_codon:yes gene_type:complete
MAKTSPAEFVKQVKNEGKKITWPSKQEVIASMIAVFIMVFISAVFLYFADQIISYVIRMILGI